VPEAEDSHEIVQVVGGPSAQVEEALAAVASVLRSWGYDMHVLAPLNRPFRRRLAASGVRAREAAAPSGASLAAHWADARSLAAQLRELRPLLIDAHGFRAALASLLARRALAQPPPVVFSPHFLPHLLAEDPRSGLRRQAYRWIIRRCDAVAVQTEIQRAQLARLDRPAAERAQVVPYGISQHAAADSLDLGRRRQLMGMNPSAAVVGCVVDALDIRALTLFLDAAHHLCMEYPSLEFALIGAGVDRTRYHDLAHARGLLGSTVFVDPRDRFVRAMSALNVLVTPQPGWPSGMLALQALSQDVGVVALEDGEVARMLGGSPAVTIAAADGPASVSDGIIQQLRAAAERVPMTPGAADAPGVSPFLVSRDFYDLADSWARPARPPQSGDDEASSSDTPALSDYAPTQAARALAAVYHRLLDEA